MARRTVEVVIETEGRDKGKTFVIKEKPADAVERWCVKALLAAGKGGVDIPDSMVEGASSALVAAGLKLIAQIPYELAQPLLDEMMECVKFQPVNRNVPLIDIGRGENCAIEEVRTFLELRKRIIELHVGFSMPVDTSNTGS